MYQLTGANHSTKSKDMTTTNTFAEETIIAFHIGRGGHFNNPGSLSFIGKKDISAFTNDLYLHFENESNFSKRFGYKSTGTRDQRCIADLITDQDFDELEEAFGIKKEELGTAYYYDGGGNNTDLTEEKADSGIGRIDIDGGYNTTYTTYLKDISENEANAILAATGYVDSEITDYAKEFLGIEEETEEN